MKKKPENVVYNNVTGEYDAFKKSYPTSFNSKNFESEEISCLKIEAKPYFKSKFSKIQEDYQNFISELKWNQRIYKSKYNFNPTIGSNYYLYKDGDKEFLSIITPNEWKKKCIGKFKLGSNYVWKKIK